jgi:uncharacterized membrane protein (UPF0127 family)
LTEDATERNKRRIILVSVLVLLIIVLSASAVLYYSRSGKSFECSSSISQTRSKELDLLSNFSVACIQIVNRSNDSTILNGLVYVAGSGTQQAQGFQNMTSFGNCNGFATSGPSCDGMIFNFSSSQELCFWMHDTLIPLQQDWIAQNGTVVSIYQAKPQNDSSVCHYAKYVLETAPFVQISLGNNVILNTNES